MHVTLRETRKVWTRDEAAQLSEMFPGQRYELIEGEILTKMGQNPPHAYVIARLNTILAAAFPGRIRIQSSITLPDPEGQYSEPEPDVVLLRLESPEFLQRHPSPADIALLIEVSDATLQPDRTVKAPLYARSGVSEYWIIDIVGKRILVFRNPADGEYGSIVIYKAGEAVSPSGEPSLTLSFDQLFR